MSWIKDWTGYLIGSTSPQVSKTGSPKDVYAGAFGLTDFSDFRTTTDQTRYLF
jgi:hypothetical protein